MLTVIAGSRNARESDVFYALNECSWNSEITQVISGTAYGADRHGEKWASVRGLEVVRFPALWDLYGRSAGPRRNKEMAQNANALIAIWDGSSTGTKTMIGYANQYSLKIMIYYYESNKIEYPQAVPRNFVNDYLRYEGANYYSFV